MSEFRYIFKCLKCKKEFTHSKEEHAKIITSELHCPACGSDMMMQVNCPEPEMSDAEKLRQLEEAIKDIDLDDLIE